MDTQVQQVQRFPNKMNPKRPTPRHIIIKMPKLKGRVLKAAREKQFITHKGAPIRLSADFSKETLQARRKQQEIFQVSYLLLSVSGRYRPVVLLNIFQHIRQPGSKVYLAKMSRVPRNFANNV